MKKFSYVLFALIFCTVLFNFTSINAYAMSDNNVEAQANPADYVKWVDFNASFDILKKVYDLDVKYHNTEVDFNFCEVLAGLAVQNGNRFSTKTDNKNLNTLLNKLVNEKKTVKELYTDNKYFNYYLECYNAIFSQFVGEYYTEDSLEPTYGMTAYFPIAKGFWYNHYDDFGNARSFGFKRVHLGHDMMGSTGTPIVAIEGGTVTEFGWNRYGGWRVGIRSFDGKRYYYYAHLKKDRPYAEGLEMGSIVQAGQVVGYLGVTGYSNKQNVNMKTAEPHLHLGLQLIFHPSQEDGNGEIWIDMYQITKFLAANRATVVKDKTTREYRSINLRTNLPNISR